MEPKKVIIVSVLMHLLVLIYQMYYTYVLVFMQAIRHCKLMAESTVLARVATQSVELPKEDGNEGTGLDLRGQGRGGITS